MVVLRRRRLDALALRALDFEETRERSVWVHKRRAARCAARLAECSQQVRVVAGRHAQPRLNGVLDVIGIVPAVVFPYLSILINTFSSEIPQRFAAESMPLGKPPVNIISMLGAGDCLHFFSTPSALTNLEDLLRHENVSPDPPADAEVYYSFFKLNS